MPSETTGGYTKMAGWELRPETEVPGFVLDFYTDQSSSVSQST